MALDLFLFFLILKQVGMAQIHTLHQHILTYVGIVIGLVGILVVLQVWNKGA